jgi:hypothetical protein
MGVQSLLLLPLVAQGDFGEIVELRTQLIELALQLLDGAGCVISCLIGQPPGGQLGWPSTARRLVEDAEDCHRNREYRARPLDVQQHVRPQRNARQLPGSAFEQGHQHGCHE